MIRVKLIYRCGGSIGMVCDNKQNSPISRFTRLAKASSEHLRRGKDNEDSGAEQLNFAQPMREVKKLHNRGVIIDETIVDLLRYGLPEPGHRFADSLNDPLRAIGWRHMRGAARTIAPWQQVICSGARSSREIAARLAREYRAPWHSVDGFDEMDFGQWRGQELDELMANPNVDLQQFWLNPLEGPPPGDESLMEFQQRVLAAWRHLLSESAGQHTLMICHAGVQRVLVGMVLGKPLDELFALQTPYAGLSRVSVVKESAGYRSSLVFQTGVR